MNIGRNIKKCRTVKKITQKEISEILNINVRTYQKYESGDINPNINTLKDISQALKVDLEVIIHWTDLLNDDPDVINFLEKIIPFYNFEVELANLLKVNNSDIDFLLFLKGESNDDHFYMKISKILELSYSQLYNWVLSDKIYTLVGYDDFNLNNISTKDIANIVNNNFLEEQTFENLLNEGLSNKNKALLKDYLSEHNIVNSKQIIKESLNKTLKNAPKDDSNKKNNEELMHFKAIRHKELQFFIQDIEELENNLLQFKTKYIDQYRKISTELEDLIKKHKEGE